MIYSARLDRPRLQRRLQHRTTAQSPDNATLAGKITEIIVQDDDINQIPMLLPLLAQLSQAPRWLTWVAPPAMLPRSLLSDAGIEINKVILLKPDNLNSEYQLACKALATGTAHVVISWSSYLSPGQIQGLEQAAYQGQSHGIIIRRRQDA